MKRWAAIFVLGLLAACGGSGDDPQAEDEPVAPTSPTVALTVEDFHTDWCLAMKPYIRAIDDLPTLTFDQGVVDALDGTVGDLDKLGIELEAAGLTEASDRVAILSDAIAEQLDVLDSHAAEVSSAAAFDWLSEQADAFPKSKTEFDPAVAELGRC